MTYQPTQQFESSTEESLPPMAPTIPFSRECEEAILGAVLINPEVYGDVATFLSSSDFYIHRHRWIWDAFGRLSSAKTEIDILTVSDELDRKGQLAEIGGPAFLTGLVNQVPSSLNAESYGRIVLSHSVRRKMITAANRIAGLAYDEAVDIEKAKEQSWQALENLTTAETRGNIQPMNIFLTKVYERADKWSQTTELPGVPTGFIDLDKLLSNMQPQDLIILAGRPGQGKSALLTDIAYHLGCPAKEEDQKNVAIFTLEMSGESVTTRILSKESGIDYQAINSGKMQENEWPKFTFAIEKLSNSGIFIDPSASLTTNQMLSRAKALKARYGRLDLIIVDYLQLAEGEGDNRTQEVAAVSRGLKKLAKELDVPVLAAAQLSRAVENRSNKRPILSDLKESGSIEQDADIVMFIYHPEEDYKQNIVEIIVAKHRNGPVGSVELVFRKALAKFENAATRMFNPNAPEDDRRDIAQSRTEANQ